MVMSKDVLFSLTKGGYAPQEEMLEVARKKGSLYIGIPKETAFQENRVPLVPDAVALLVNHGHKIVIEAGAGTAAHLKILTIVKQEQKLFTQPNKYIKQILS